MAVLPPGIDFTRVVFSGRRLCSRASLGYIFSKIISRLGQLWTGPYVWSQLIGLVSYEADVNSALRGLELIYVQYRHTCKDQRSCTGKGK